jgi:hypothetical protein
MVLMITLKTLATPPPHPPNHYSCLLSIGTSWRYCYGRQAAVLFRYRCSSPLASTCKTYDGTYGVSVFYSADCSFRSFAGCLGPKNRVLRSFHVNKQETDKRRKKMDDLMNEPFEDEKQQAPFMVRKGLFLWGFPIFCDFYSILETG